MIVQKTVPFELDEDVFSFAESTLNGTPRQSISRNVISS
jgi:hypothetical protein